MTAYAHPQGAQWFHQRLEQPETFPFCFTYRGVRYEGFPQDTFRPVEMRRETADGRQRVIQKLKADDGLVVTLNAAYYPDYGVSEWTLWFENEGEQDSGRLEDMETVLEFAGAEPMLKGILGDHVNDYRPYQADLMEAPVRFVSDSGRATHVYFPYFNLEYGQEGALLAIGWAGTWTAGFAWRDGVTTYRARSVNGLSTCLKPGEKIRTALFVRAPYGRRDEAYATNFWRSWFMACNLPPADAKGTPLAPFSTCCLASDTGLPNSDGSISERASTWRPSLEKMLAEDVKVDFRWFDAGWYVAPDGASPQSDWWGTVGTWKLDPAKWPGDTFRQSTDFARAHGMKTLMWFEPERVTDPESLERYYGYDPAWAIRREGCKAISNNIGNPDCLRWTLERICGTLRENRVEMYREDNNSDPAELWRFLDEREGEGRHGITECKFIQAHYAMWDQIIACTMSYGGCGFVDSCASGGGRNDLESLRRGIPLLRSDADRTTTSLRLSMTTALNRWIPFCGANTKEKAGQLDATGRSDVYTWRASYLPVLNVDAQFVQDPEQDFDLLRFGLREWKRLSPYLLKDFYVLTPWHSQEERDGFTAYCFFDGQARKGAMLLFRMEDCQEPDLPLRLPFLQQAARCRLRDEDTGEILEMDGARLGEEGITWHMPQPRSARLIWIEEA